MANEISSNSYEHVLEEIRDLKQRIDVLYSLYREDLLSEEILEEIFPVLVCRTDVENVGILLKYVDEVVPMCKVASIPDAPSWIAGLLNLGGEMIPVVDLSARINNLSHEAALSDFIVICTIEKKRLGLIVNEVSGVYDKKREELQLVSERMVASPFLLGIADLEGRPLLVLNMSGILSVTEAVKSDRDHD